MTTEQISKANAELRPKSPLEIIRWAIAQASGRAIVSTNFRPYEAVILHLVTVGGVPLLALLAWQFPWIGQIAFSWLRPLWGAIH